MKANQFSPEQIIKILQQAEKGEQTIGAICREHGITETTFYRWRKQYSGMTVAEVQRLKELEKENTRLKRLLAERDLEVDTLNSPFAYFSGANRIRHTTLSAKSFMKCDTFPTLPMTFCTCVKRFLKMPPKWGEIACCIASLSVAVGRISRTVLKMSER
jgi:putative transposase